MCHDLLRLSLCSGDLSLFLSFFSYFVFEGLDETLDRLGGPGALGDLTWSDSASFLLSFGWLSLLLSLLLQ